MDSLNPSAPAVSFFAHSWERRLQSPGVKEPPWKLPASAELVRSQMLALEPQLKVTALVSSRSGSLTPASQGTGDVLEGICMTVSQGNTVGLPEIVDSVMGRVHGVSRVTGQSQK